MDSRSLILARGGFSDPKTFMEAVTEDLKNGVVTLQQPHGSQHQTSPNPNEIPLCELVWPGAQGTPGEAITIAYRKTKEGNTR